MSTKKRTNMTAAQVEAFLPLLKACGVEVVDPDTGEVVCPGIDLHTTPNAPCDCLIFQEGSGFLHLHCFHASCGTVRKLTNNALRQAITISRSASYGPTETEAARRRQQVYEAKRAETEREQKLAASMLPDILKSCHWPAETIAQNSTMARKTPFHQHWAALLCLFDDDDIIWIGRDKYDSGRRGHRWRFRRVGEWLGQRECPGVLTCPSTFQPGVYQRFEQHVLAPKFLVVESDKLTREQVGAVFRWVEREHDLPLRAVVDTGNRSLHAWFEYPSPPLLEKLRLWLPALGCDGSMFKPNQPCRLPGTLRPETGNEQRLIYIE